MDQGVPSVIHCYAAKVKNTMWKKYCYNGNQFSRHFVHYRGRLFFWDLFIFLEFSCAFVCYLQSWKLSFWLLYVLFIAVKNNWITNMHCDISKFKMASLLVKNAILEMIKYTVIYHSLFYSYLSLRLYKIFSYNFTKYFVQASTIN